MDKKKTKNLAQDEKNLLLADYQECHNGYNHRDYTIQDEFSNLVQAFVFFLTLILAIHVFEPLNLFFNVIIHIALMFAGLFALFAFLLDIQANTSCKKALRDHCIKIEDAIKDPQFFQIFKEVIPKRRKYWFESNFKKPESYTEAGGLIERTIGDAFSFTGICFIFIWVLISGSLSVKLLAQVITKTGGFW